MWHLRRMGAYINCVICDTWAPCIVTKNWWNNKM